MGAGLFCSSACPFILWPAFCCAGSGDIGQLTVFRVLQAVGGSAAFAVATAMIKDVYDSRKPGDNFSLVSSMVLISPMAAPVLGAVLLVLLSWRGVFLVLGGIGLLALAGSIALEETLDKRYTGTLRQAWEGWQWWRKIPGFTSFAHHFFSAERFRHGFYCIIFIYLYRWLRPERAGSTALFRLQCPGNDWRAHALSAALPTLRAPIDHHGLFCLHLCGRRAGILFGSLQPWYLPYAFFRQR